MLKSLCNKSGYNLYLTWGYIFFQSTLSQKKHAGMHLPYTVQVIVGLVVHTSENEDTSEHNKHDGSFI